ncbi:MAG: hypothetical protein VX278_00035 [Myxococcota bacterium]|nr:hypothetical protein [Myxococcota bacterium]
MLFSTKEKEGWREYTLIFLLFFAISIAITYPVILDPTALVIGDAKSDIWDHLWGYWRTEKALLIDGRYPLDEPYINYPVGGSLYHVDFLNSLFMLPISSLFGMIAGYNLLVWIHLSAVGVAMYALCRRVVRTRVGSLMAAVVFVFNPQMLCFTLASGVANRLNLVWIPLFFIVLDIWIRGHKIWAPFLCAFFCLCAALGCWHYSYYIFMLTLLLSAGTILHALFTHPKKLLFWSKKWLPVAVLCGVVLYPISKLASESISSESEGLIYQREHFLFWDGKVPIKLLNDFALTDYIQIFSSGPMQTSNFDLLYETPYIGWSLLLLAPFALLSRKRIPILLFASALYFIVLSLGTEIKLTHNATPIFSWVFYVSARVIPFMTAQEVPWEYLIPANFCLSLCCAYACQYLLEGFEGWRRNVLALEWMAIFVLEACFISPSILPVPNSKVEYTKFYEQIAEESGEFAVFDFPSRRDRSNLLPTEYFFFQTIHKKPIPYAIMNAWIDQNEFWSELTRAQQKGGQVFDFSSVDLKNAQGYLYRKRFRYFVLHKSLLNKNSQKQFRALFENMFGNSMYEDSLVVVFRTDRR